jgi:hypothetical protein
MRRANGARAGWRCSRNNYPIDGTIATLGIAHGHVSASVVRRKSAVSSTAYYTTSAVGSQEGLHDACKAVVSLEPSHKSQ